MNEVDKTVIKAFKLAGNKLEKPITIDELLEFIPKTGVKILKRTYGSHFKDKLYKTVNKLKNKQLIIYCGKSGRENFYIHADYTEFDDKKLPIPQGERILKVFTEAVADYKRPIAFNELKSFAADKLFKEDLRNLARILSQLADMEKIIKLSKITGMENSRNVYSLPNKQFNKDFEIPVTTQSHAVKKSFDVLWEHNCRKAQLVGELPRPVLTKQLRKYVWKHYSNVLGKKKILDSVLLSLKHYENPFMRKIEREGFYFNAWAPHDSIDDQLNLKDFYANNQEKISVAVKRAWEKYNRPVTVSEVQEQMKVDRALALDIDMSFNAFLSSAAKNVNNPNKKAIRRAGEYLNKTYYIFGNEKADAEALKYVLFLNSRLKFKRSKFQKRLDSIENCKLQTVILGRALLIKEEAEEMKTLFNEILSGNKLFISEDVFDKCEKLINKLEHIIKQADSLILKTNLKKSNVPKKICRYVQTISAEDLIPILSLTYPAIARATDPNVVIRLLKDKYIRLENPEFKNRFSDNANEAARYLYDLTDVLMKTAIKRGGLECNFQATLAINELGRLRDEKFVLPALESKDFEERLTAVACLVFISNKTTKKALRNILFNENNSGIRKAAVWGCRFGTGKDWKKTLEKVVKEDNNNEVSLYAQTLITTNMQEVWNI